jgi:hypothetical protein
MATRHCAECRRILGWDSFSKTQWSKAIGVSRCNSCVHGTPASKPPPPPKQSTRTNNAHNASFSHEALDYPFSSGTFRWVALGKYTDGARQGEKCVCKWFKSGSVYEQEFFADDIKAVQKAAHIIQEWNSRNFIDKTIMLNIPQVWRFTDGCSRAGQRALIEPFIEKYKKFNSNSGWADDSIPWSRLLQALSHFSYHASRGQLVLCDLQGGIYSNGVSLTDPAVCSVSKSYGVTDLGSAGISNFFSQHRCNEFCRSEWTRPADQTQYLPVQRGSSMMSSLEHVQTQRSRPALSMPPPPPTICEDGDY